MSLFKRLFSGRGGLPATINDAALFRERVTEHRSRMLTAGESHAAFLHAHLSDEIVELLSPMAAQKMALTQNDGEEHSVMVARSPVCYVLCTLRLKLGEASGWFERRYGGYGELLAQCWNTDTYRTTACEVLCHITYGRSRENAWTNITIFPVRSDHFTFQPILAIDLLSRTERRTHGIS